MKTSAMNKKVALKCKSPCAKLGVFAWLLSKSNRDIGALGLVKLEQLRITGLFDTLQP